MQVACSTSNPRGKKGLSINGKNESTPRHNKHIISCTVPAVDGRVVEIGTLPIAQQQQHGRQHDVDRIISKGLSSSTPSSTSNKASLKRARKNNRGATTARSHQIHQLPNDRQIIICSDDSPGGHYFGGRLPIVVGIEDEQVAPPQRKLFLSFTKRRQQQPAPPATVVIVVPTNNNNNKRNEVTVKEPEEETSNNYSLRDLFDGPYQEANGDGEKTLDNNNNDVPRQKSLDDMLQLPPEYKKTNEFISSSLVVHGSGIRHIDQSQDWDRVEKIFQESALSSERGGGGVEPVVGRLLPTKSSLVGCTLVAELVLSGTTTNAAAADESSSKELSSFFCGGHESEISIDPLNDFSPRKSTRAKAAVARRSTLLDSVHEADDDVTPFPDDSVRHKSFQSLQQSKGGGGRSQPPSQHSRYNNDDSLVVAPVRKSRRDVDANKKPSTNRSKVINTRRPNQSPTPSERGVGMKDRSSSSTTTTIIVQPPQDRSSSNTIKREHCDTSQIGTIMEDLTTSTELMEAPSNDSSTTMGNKSSSGQEFAQLDLTGGQQGIRMVNRAEVLTEQRPGLHERKVVLPPQQQLSGGVAAATAAALSTTSNRISGLLRSKMASSFRSVSSRRLGDTTTNMYGNINHNINNGILMMMPQQLQQHLQHSPPPPATIGLAKYRSHSSRCLTKQSNATLLDDDASSIEFGP